ncbi:MAG: thioesterase family protein [Pseudomonadota bacterium]
MIHPTRWNDNDMYGHINNTVYYEWFDTVVNRWLIENNLLFCDDSRLIGLVVETGCQYFSPISFPDPVTIGLRVAHVGTSSVRYEIGIFGEVDAQTSARGNFVHVYVDEETRRPVRLYDTMKEKLGELKP